MGPFLHTEVPTAKNKTKLKTSTEDSRPDSYPRDSYSHEATREHQAITKLASGVVQNDFC